MITVYSIDPSSGVSSALGWAMWRGQALIACGLVRGVKGPLDTRCAHYAAQIPPPVFGGCVVWVEQMEMSKQRDGKDPVHKLIAKANDLLAVQAVGAHVAGRLGGILRYATPGVWKGSAPKHVTKNRARGTLSAQELQLVDAALSPHPESLAHNLYDSIGVGLHATGRYRLPGRAA